MRWIFRGTKNDFLILRRPRSGRLEGRTTAIQVIAEHGQVAQGNTGWIRACGPTRTEPSRAALDRLIGAHPVLVADAGLAALVAAVGDRRLPEIDAREVGDT